MPAGPLAYHITFGTYGGRLHGDPRGTVDRSMNHPGDPIVGADAVWWSQEHRRLNFPPVELTRDQMTHAESAIPGICDRGQWRLHVCAAGPDHVHTVLTALRPDAAPEAIRRWLKRWLGESLSARWPRPDRSTWWAEGGSVKWVWSDEYFERVRKYVYDQRATPSA